MALRRRGGRRRRRPPHPPTRQRGARDVHALGDQAAAGPAPVHDRRARGARHRRRGAGARGGVARRQRLPSRRRRAPAREGGRRRRAAGLRRALADRHARGGPPPVRGEDRDPLRHNCSGKHAGFLAVARTLGVAPERYLDPDSPVQAAVKRAVAEACEFDPAANCQPPPTAAALRTSPCRSPRSRAASRTSRPAARPVRRSTPRSPRSAGRCRRTPCWCRGRRASTRSCMRAFAGRIVCKGGAEGLQAIGFADPPLGIAVKVVDGGERALPPICLAVLRALGLTRRCAARRARRSRAPDCHQPSAARRRARLSRRWRSKKFSPDRGSGLPGGD